MWKNASEELPPSNELVLLQLVGDEYTTGWYSSFSNNGNGAWMGMALNQSPPQFRIADGAVEKWCEIVRPYDAPDGEKRAMLRAFWAILEGALKHNDGAPLWANSTTTAFEALAELAHDYAPDVAREFQERLEQGNDMSAAPKEVVAVYVLRLQHTYDNLELATLGNFVSGFGRVTIGTKAYEKALDLDLVKEDGTPRPGVQQALIYEYERRVAAGALKHNNGAPAFEALAELAHDYAPDVAREFQERLEG